jgi:hypothetical protein
VQRAIDRMVAAGAEEGIQVAVIARGRVVADAVSGVADRPPTLTSTPAWRWQ